MEAAAVVMAFVALAYAGWRWGEDSVDGIDSVEWSRRRNWFGRFASRTDSRPRERSRTRVASEPLAAAGAEPRPAGDVFTANRIYQEISTCR